MGKLRGAPRKNSGHKKHSKEKPEIPNLDERLKSANPKGQVLPPENESLTSETISAKLESVLGTDAAAAIEMVMTGKGAGAFATLAQMQHDVAQLSIMPGPQRRQLLLQQLEVAALQGAKIQNTLLALIADPNTTEPAREVLMNRLGKVAFFNRSVTDQSLAIRKVGYIDDGTPAEEQDPADLSLEEWEKRFQPRLMAGNPGTETKQ